GYSTIPAESSCTPACSSMGLIAFQRNCSLAAVRLMRRPAPWLADSSDSGTPPAHDEAGRRHRTGDHAQHIKPRGRRAFTMHDHLPAVVGLLPREIVMIRHAGDH